MWEVAGSVIGQMLAQGKHDEVRRIREEAMRRFGNTSLSSLESIAKEQLGPSKLGGVQMDAKYKSAQDAALEKLMGISNAEGMDAQSVAKLDAAKQAAFGVQRGMQGAAEQDLAQRGMLDSGALVTSKMGAAQAGADRAYHGGVAAAGDASQRALEALMAGGSMAGRMGEADLAQKNLVASADDRIAQFNLGHKGQAERDLVNAKLAIANGMNGVGNQQAGDAEDEAARIQNTARGLGKAAGTAYNYVSSDEQIDPLTGKKKPAAGDPYDRQQDW